MTGIWASVSLEVALRMTLMERSSRKLGGYQPRQLKPAEKSLHAYLLVRARDQPLERCWDSMLETLP